VANKRRPPSRGMIITLKLLLSLGLVAWILYYIGPSQLLERLQAARFLPLLGAMLMLLGGVAISSYCWSLLLRPQAVRISWWYSFRLNLIGFFFNNILPSGLAGDVWRAHALTLTHPGLGRSFASIFMERIIAFSVLTTVTVGTLVVVGRPLHSARLWGYLALMALAMVIAVAAGIWLLTRGRHTSWFRRLVPPDVEMDRFLEGLNQYRHHGSMITWVACISVVNPLLDAMAHYLMSVSLGMGLPAWPFFILIPLIRILNHVPVVINGIGPQEGVFLLFWGQLGVAAAPAVSLSLLSHGVKIGVGCIGGLFYAARLLWERPVVVSELDPRPAD